MRRATPLEDELPEHWLDPWETYVILKRSTISPATLANYLDTLVQFARFLGPEPPELGEVGRLQVASFIDCVKERTTATTAAMRWRGLSAVFGWWAAPGEGDEPYINASPVKGTRPPKTDDEPIPVLDYDEVRRLLATCRRRAVFEDVRDTAIIHFLFDTGCRRGEIASMRTEAEWLDLRDGEAKVVGKTGPRIVSIGDRTAASIKRYLRARDRHAARELPWLWLGRFGRLSGSGIYQTVAGRFEAAKIDARKKVHIFRHSFSHHFRMEGGSDSELTTLNGWSGPAMAMRYGKSAAQARAREAHKRHSPGNKL